MKRYILLLVTLIFLSSCGPSATTTLPPASTDTAVPTEIPAPIDVTATPSPRPTLTPLPTSTVTLTALPTLTTSETEKFLLGLYNNNCTLPCWGGFVPGKITWLEVKQQLEAANIKVFSAKDGGSANFEIPRLGLRSGIEFFAEKGEVIMIRPYIVYRSLDLQPLLLKHGKPDEVWIFSSPRPGPPNYVPVTVVLFYKKGISIEYTGYTANVKNDYYEICLGSQLAEEFPMLFIWEEGRYMSLEKFMVDTKVIGGLFNGKTYLKPLEDVTEISVEDFYSNLVKPNNNYCIETPKSNW